MEGRGKCRLSEMAARGFNTREPSSYANAECKTLKGSLIQVLMNKNVCQIPSFEFIGLGCEIW